MKAILSLIFFTVLGVSSFSQSISSESIEDSVLGWMKVYNFKGAKEGKKVDDKLYSAAQLSICDSFANWIQASYTPKGGLGDVHRTVSEKIGLYNTYKASWPQSYGVSSTTYTSLKYNSSGKRVPEYNFSAYWGIYANGVLGWVIMDLSNPTQYYFTMPSFETANGGGDTKKIHDLTNIPALKPYTTFWIKDTEIGGGTDCILLSKGNRSPYVKLTKGEYLKLLEVAIPRIYQEEKTKIYKEEKGNQRSIDYLMKYLDEKTNKRLACLKNNKERYKNRLNETAAVFAAQPNAMLENFEDVFEGNGGGGQRYPVYKIDPEMSELCKKDKPQWVLISWQWAPHVAVEKHMHESFLNNFNFDYVYNFFFDPEKVKGQPYKPLRNPNAKEEVKVLAASASSKKITADKNVYFFEDFSTTAVGKIPNGWQAKLSRDGTTSTIVNPDGLEGNWAVMTANHILIPTQLKKPLPQNFTLSYDLVAAKGFAWGAKGLLLKLAKETSPGQAESYLEVRLRPGFDGRDGELSIEPKFPSPPGYLNQSKWVVAPGFSNNKKNNHIFVTIKKVEETLQIFIDNKKVAEYEKAIPSAHLFNALSFSVAGNTGENDKYYISNIKITRD